MELETQSSFREEQIQEKKKLVVKVKDECGIWIEDQKAIVEKFVSYYKQRFKSTNNNHRTPSTIGLSRLVLDNDNFDLTYAFLTWKK